MTSRMVAAAGVVLVSVIVAAAFLWAAGLEVPSTPAETFSFEVDLEGWAAGSADLAFGNCTGASQGNCTVSWSVERTTELARNGQASVKMSLDNLNDAGKIWIERSFDATPGRTYLVHLAFAVASADFGSVNHWGILAGAMNSRPAAGESLTTVVRGDTGNGLDSAGGYVWLQKGYDCLVRAGPDGHVWVVVGVWGTWEGPRTYYIDSVNVAIEPA